MIAKEMWEKYNGEQLSHQTMMPSFAGRGKTVCALPAILVTYSVWKACGRDSSGYTTTSKGLPV
jgi:hypothetical protein